MPYVRIQNILNTSLLVVVASWSSVSTAKPDSNSGTKKRVEQEYKLSFTNLPAPRESVAKFIFQRIESEINLNKWKFSDRVPYELVEKPLPFIYRDLYFDTKNLDLFNNSISYRLRHRWKDPASYRQHQRYPKQKRFYPIRCEIQLKTDYRKNSSGMTLADETRFEFRNESLPFSIKKNAPPPPWPLAEFSTYAKTGKYQAYEILPFTELKKKLPKLSSLKDSLLLETERVRAHIDMKNKWGSGPNPNQVFILTLDYSRIKAFNKDLVKKPNKDWRNANFVEFEIEIDRSVLQKIADNLQNSSEAKQAKANLESDLKKLHNIVSDFMAKTYSIKPRPSQSKFTRVMKRLM